MDMVRFEWHVGFASRQKNKSIHDMHQVILKKYERLITSGELISYNYFGIEWSVEPLTAFYDWLYVNALKQNPQLHEEVMQYQAFTDMEFNPKKSIHCAAYALAMFVALNKRELLDNVEDPAVFFNLYHDFKVSNTE
nr:hypothetical protein [Psychrobacter sp. GP33]